MNRIYQKFPIISFKVADFLFEINVSERGALSGQVVASETNDATFNDTTFAFHYFILLCYDLHFR